MGSSKQHSICEYYRSKRKEMRQRQSSMEPTGQTKSQARLSKPPKLSTLHQRPRNRLQKRIVAPSNRQNYPALYLLEREQYPYQTRPSEFLGVYSSINSVTSGAFENGAYTFSREGLLDGSEYLSPTGRIKIHSQVIQQSGLEVATPEERKKSQSAEYVRLDIPHPDSQEVACEKTNINTEPRESVYLAIRQTPNAALCIGIFTKKSLAWGACLKDRAACALSGSLREESQSTDMHGMPQVKGRLEGYGLHLWFVKSHEIDG
jgi:hypothetical protein